MSKIRNILLIITIILTVLIIIWIIFNPIGKFGYHKFGFTVFSSIPFPVVDLKIKGNGFPVIRKKSHFISLKEIKDLLGNNKEKYPDYLIIGTGYDNMVRVDEEVFKINSIKIIVLPTDQAIKIYNCLKKDRKKVACIIHSTC